MFTTEARKLVSTTTMIETMTTSVSISQTATTTSSAFTARKTTESMPKTASLTTKTTPQRTIRNFPNESIYIQLQQPLDHEIKNVEEMEVY